ncbi:MAG: signal recognition particle protein [Deltaproteobacteria bacterium]|nr:signal recognition particle protein [Deltaproteobacteria bacterium]
MFENLTEKLNQTFKRLKGHGKLSEQNIQEALKEVRITLLEADVNFKVVKEFIEGVRQKSLGQEVLKSFTPAQQFIKIVKDELISLMGDKENHLSLAGKGPHSIMVVGLQGSGKTTTIGKLARLLLDKNHTPFLVPADVYRPAAIEQLKTLGAQLGVAVYETDRKQNPIDICKDALNVAVRKGFNVLLIDTAGRWHIDEELMVELKNIKEKINPQEILFIADAMTGQEAVNVATSFDEMLDINGVVLTKMDGDARGGAALSIKAVTKKPIKFVGVGEKMDALEVFYPDRMASRILGMGDVLSLIEKAEDAIDAEEAVALEKKIKKDGFTLEDFRSVFQQIKKMGPLQDILGMIPGVNNKALKSMQVDDKKLVRMEAILNSMTTKERGHPSVLNGSRRKRIAKGSGTSVQEVNKLIKQYMQTRKMMKSFSKGKMGNFGGLLFNS